MNTEHFERLVGTGIKAYGIVSAIGESIREYADDAGIKMTEQEFIEILVEVHNRVR